MLVQRIFVHMILLMSQENVTNVLLGLEIKIKAFVRHVLIVCSAKGQIQKIAFTAKFLKDSLAPVVKNATNE